MQDLVLGRRQQVWFEENALPFDLLRWGTKGSTQLGVERLLRGVGERGNDGARSTAIWPGIYA